MSIVLNNREINWELAYNINDNKYYEALIEAEIYPSFDILRKILSTKDAYFDEHPDFIYKACREGNFEIIKSINTSKISNIMLYIVATRGYFDIVKYIKENTLAEPDITVSYRCIKNGHINVAKYICQNWPDKCVKFFVMEYVRKYAPEHKDEFEIIFIANKFLALKKHIKNN